MTKLHDEMFLAGFQQAYICFYYNRKAMAKTIKKNKLFSSTNGKIIKESDIKDAEITEEIKNHPTEEEIDEFESSSTESSTEQESFDDNNLGSEDVDLKEKKQKDPKGTIDFMDEEHMENYVKSKTKDADLGEDEEEEGSNPLEGKSVDEIRKTLRDEEKNQAESFTYKDFEMIADFLIGLIDTGISTALKAYAGDTSYSPYSIPKERHKRLRGQLTLILMKYQRRFSLEFMFLISLVFCYATPFMNARAKRKERKALGLVGKLKGNKGFNPKPQTRTEDETKDEPKVTKSTNTGSGAKLQKRGRGRVAKG